MSYSRSLQEMYIGVEQEADADLPDCSHSEDLEGQTLPKMVNEILEIAQENQIADIEEHDQDQTQEVHDALKNSLVIQRIIQHLDFTDLKNTRLTFKDWIIPTAVEIMKRGIVKIEMSHSSSQDTFFISRGSKDEEEEAFSLTSLIDCITKSSKFPCDKFEFSSGNLIDSLPFFSACGSIVKSLSVHADDYPMATTTKETFSKILQSVSNTLEFLCFDDGFVYDWDDDDDDSPQLPALKTIDLTMTCSDTSTVKGIVSGASVLETIIGMPIDHAEVIMEAGKSHCIKNFRLSVSNWMEIMTLEKLAGHLSPLRKLEFCLPFLSSASKENGMMIQKSFMKILELSQNTLEDLQLDTLYPIKLQINLGRLPQLKKLSFREFENLCETEDVFRPKFRVTSTFPQLTWLSVFDDSWMDVLQMTDHPYGNVIPSVTQLEVFAPCNVKWLKVLCPNVNKIRVHCTDQRGSANSMIRNICKEYSSTQSSLQQLDIIVVIRGSDFRSLDVGLTGFTHAHITKLLSDGDDDQNGRASNEGDLKRKFPWIGSINGLKTVNIIIKNTFFWVKSSEDSRGFPLTWVSGRHVFQRLAKDVDFTILYDFHNDRYDQSELLKEALVPLNPYVKMMHYDMWDKEDYTPPPN